MPAGGRNRIPPHPPASPPPCAPGVHAAAAALPPTCRCRTGGAGAGAGRAGAPRAGRGRLRRWRRGHRRRRRRRMSRPPPPLSAVLGLPRLSSLALSLFLAFFFLLSLCVRVRACAVGHPQTRLRAPRSRLGAGPTRPGRARRCGTHRGRQGEELGCPAGSAASQQIRGNVGRGGRP